MSKEILLRAEKLLIYTQTPQSDIEAAAAVLLKRHAAFQGIEIAQPTLEDVYLRLTQSERKIPQQIHHCYDSFAADSVADTL